MTMDSPPVKTVSTFVSKLYNMLEDSTQAQSISWMDDGLSFKVTDPMEFQSSVLPKYFKHNNFSSFVRQLNLYGFHKGDPHLWLFAHEDFIRGHKEHLHLIKRRTGVNEKQQAAMGNGSRDVYYNDSKNTSAEMAELRTAVHVINDRLQKQTEENSNMWKKLLATQAALQDNQNKFKRLLNLVGHMCLPDDESLNTPTKRRATLPGRPDFSSDVTRNPSFAQFDFNRPSQLNIASALGQLSDSNINLRALSSMRVIPQEFLSQLRSGASMTHLPSMSQSNGDPEYDQWMRELQESGMMDPSGNPDVNYPALQSVSQTALPMMGGGPSMSAFTSLLNPAPGGPSSMGEALSSSAALPNPSSLRQPSTMIGGKRQREESDAVDAMVALRRSSVANFPAVQMSAGVKDQLRQLILESRADDSGL